MSVLIFFIVLYILLGLSMMKLFEKAGIPGWKALVPGLAAVEWCKMVGRKPQYALWFLFPVVNFFIYAGLVIDMIRSFGRHGFWESVLAVVFAPIPFFMVGRDEKAKYEGPILEKEREYHRLHHEAIEKKDTLGLKKLEAQYPQFKKTALREWTEAIVFAVFAAAFIRMFLIEAYVIPSSSMEGTLKIGDYLFVSKAHYGIRTPMTVIQFPLMHNVMPVLGTESYLEQPTLPYYRLPALETVDRNEPVVFNWPAGDSVILLPDRSYDKGQYLRNYPRLKKDYFERFKLNLPANPDWITRPVDKKDHYIKRCLAIGGDSLEIRGGQIFVNGQAAQNPTHMQFSYNLESSGNSFNTKKLEDFGVNTNELYRNQRGKVCAFLDMEQVEKVRGIGLKAEREKREPDPGNLFPNDPTRNQRWTIDDYGPVWIPKKGATAALTPESLPFYWRIIAVYEGNKLEVRDGKIYINGQETTSYTFKQDYYWMQGDNRHNSEDSRFWGYVPADHVVGKPLFIWFSTRSGSMFKGINWNRIFKSASTM
ncbi:MAG: S26 family signal peptidase [Saprospiraceae bacterium]|nr:S26 family signal peptidase [Saprospiraceae bacterium]